MEEVGDEEEDQQQPVERHTDTETRGHRTKSLSN